MPITMPNNTSGTCSRDRQTQHLPAPHLTGLAILRDFEESDRHALAGAGSITTVKRGECVITQGEAHDILLIILAGRFLVTRDDKKIAEIGVGQICGEMEMLNPPHSTASVTALSEACVWQITRSQLRNFMEKHTEAGRLVMKLLTSTFAARLPAH